jgi:hypothetical protein
MRLAPVRPPPPGSSASTFNPRGLETGGGYVPTRVGRVPAVGETFGEPGPGCKRRGRSSILSVRDRS